MLLFIDPEKDNGVRRFRRITISCIAGAFLHRKSDPLSLCHNAKAMNSCMAPLIFGHWIWGDGWLSQLGFHDFAGSTVVHSLGGWAALTGAWILGPRLGKYGKDGSIHPTKGHNLTLGALGVFILWLGWFGQESAVYR